MDPRAAQPVKRPSEHRSPLLWVDQNAREPPDPVIRRGDGAWGYGRQNQAFTLACG
jgi:hypothetical protein